jgi:hypothetical protein
MEGLLAETVVHALSLGNISAIDADVFGRDRGGEVERRW